MYFYLGFLDVYCTCTHVFKPCVAQSFSKYLYSNVHVRMWTTSMYALYSYSVRVLVVVVDRKQSQALRCLSVS